MIELKRILCPVDFSEHSGHALIHAATLARRYDAALTVQYVSSVRLPAAALGHGIGPSGAETILMSAVDADELLGDLRAFAAATNIGELGVDYRVTQGEVVRTILAEAVALGADLIVMGTHGRSGFERLVLGSVAEKVLRKAPCSILLVPPRSSAPPAPRLFERIVVATDFSAAAVHAMDYALSLARETDARLTVVHVVDMPDTTGAWVTSGEEVAAVAREIAASARRQLADAVPGSAREWCRATERLETGRPYQAILKVAEEEQAGLIVLGAHGHGVIDRMFFGSTAQHVVRAAACPVLTVRQ
jgi:nucleotide-binding universal stress UspA family protein